MYKRGNYADIEKEYGSMEKIKEKAREITEERHKLVSLGDKLEKLLTARWESESAERERLNITPFPFQTIGQRESSLRAITYLTSALTEEIFKLGRALNAEIPVVYKGAEKLNPNG